MIDNLYITAVIRLILAVVLGGAIGFERAERGREAGLRTHIFVCLGACLVMLISEYITFRLNLSGDIARLGAQVISGIGFLGVGCIITGGDRVKGLTTAAGLWVTACIGLSIGIGYYAVAISTVVIMILVMIFITPISNKLIAANSKVILGIKVSGNDTFDAVCSHLGTRIIKINSVEKNENKGFIKASLILTPMKPDDMAELICEINRFDGVLEIISKN